MKANEFCYWLQGYFEICEAQGVARGSLDAATVRCVRAHLDLVKETEPNHANVFVAWLTEHIKDAVIIDSTEIRRFLAAQFQHVIDPSYGGDQQKLNQLHSKPAGAARPKDVLYRC